MALGPLLTYWVQCALWWDWRTPFPYPRAIPVVTLVCSGFWAGSLSVGSGVCLLKKRRNQITSGRDLDRSLIQIRDNEALGSTEGAKKNKIAVSKIVVSTVSVKLFCHFDTQVKRMNI